jgi:hypothetical protein
MSRRKKVPHIWIFRCGNAECALSQAKQTPGRRVLKQPKTARPDPTTMTSYENRASAAAQRTGQESNPDLEFGTGAGPGIDPGPLPAPTPGPTPEPTLPSEPDPKPQLPPGPIPTPAPVT